MAFEYRVDEDDGRVDVHLDQPLYHPNLRRDLANRCADVVELRRAGQQDVACGHILGVLRCYSSSFSNTI